MGGSGCARARAWSFSSWWVRIRLCSAARASVWCACACLCVFERVDPCVHPIACAFAWVSVCMGCVGVYMGVCGSESVCARLYVVADSLMPLHTSVRA